MEEIHNQLRVQYPRATDAGVYAYGNASPVATVSRKYTSDKDGITSPTAGCGGWAARVFDAIFGQNVTVRKVDVSEARLGDIVVTLDDRGRLTHLSIVSKHYSGVQDLWFLTTDANYGGGTNVMTWDIGACKTINYEIWTTYPDSAKKLT